MNVALLISGYFRSFGDNIPLIKEKILDAFENVDVYLHITENEYQDDRYLNSYDNAIDNIEKILSPIATLKESNIIKYGDVRDDIINTWQKYYKLNKIKKINEDINNKKYDLVIKYRPDLNIITNDIFSAKIEEDIIYIPEESVIDTSRLENPNDPVLCDIFAYGQSAVMDSYFDIFTKIEDLISQHGHVSETLLFHHLNDNKIKYKSLNIEYNVILSSCNVFAICGDSGSGKTTLSNILKQYFSNSFTLECDRYHKWERGDENWKKYTHLNPDANYIAKMNKDIFDLKVGKKVYHVNYDHKNGKFTETEQINNSDNVIVCGLHSLYHHNNELYNLKIFIDTDIELKTRWKIARDTASRNYTPEQIQKQIDGRKKDYEKYIYPQRELSDIVISFSSIEGNDDLQLSILINKKYNIAEMLNEFTRHNISYEVNYECEPTFNSITFKQYQRTKLLEKYNICHNNYYDYIMFFILSLYKK